MSTGETYMQENRFDAVETREGAPGYQGADHPDEFGFPEQDYEEPDTDKEGEDPLELFFGESADPLEDREKLADAGESFPTQRVYDELGSDGYAGEDSVPVTDGGQSTTMDEVDHGSEEGVQESFERNGAPATWDPESNSEVGGFETSTKRKNGPGL